MYQLLNVSGTDADSFLQGQLTQDISRLLEGSSLPAAWCTPKGRVVATMKLIRSGDSTDLLLPDAIATTFLQRISIYKLRADVQLEIRTDRQGIAIDSAAERGGGGLLGGGRGRLGGLLSAMRLHGSSFGDSGRLPPKAAPFHDRWRRWPGASP